MVINKYIEYEKIKAELQEQELPQDEYLKRLQQACEELDL